MSKRGKRRRNRRPRKRSRQTKAGDDMDWDEIASEADRKIQGSSGGSRGDRFKYIEGLEHVIRNLECCLEAAKTDQRREDDSD